MRKNIVIFIVLICFAIFLFVGVFFMVKKNDGSMVVKKEPISLCYYYSNKTPRDFYDRAWLRLHLYGEKVTGEFRNYPGEKDSKIGEFSGTVGKLNQNTMSRQADVMWDSFAEGMNVTEELLINFGDGSASVGFGEMIDRGDGVYVYKDKTKMTYFSNLNQIACEDLDEKILVEKYIRENISKIATDKPVLGGSWFVISVDVIPSTNSGVVEYEDGHIKSIADFKYNFDLNTKVINIESYLKK